ncbi:hypothetical protein L0A91_10795 [Ornithinimicrobium sp. INDO-MA30-4]|nr:glycine betaine ABC transporter substrate-binding protein [Ornithinimicrobium sp. INDO-MA30-4]UJH69769.1 hypothetical protein L0A91_10795 [Ornithinimicrobium sp. INDO-MA30-4]
MKRTSILAATLAAGLTLSACGGDSDPLDDSGEESGSSSSDTITIGSASFPENVLLMEIYAAALSDAGVDVETRGNIGQRETYIAGLDDGSIDMIPEYTGALTLYLNADAEATDPDGVYAELQDALPENLTVLEPSAAEDKDSIVVTAETASSTTSPPLATSSQLLANWSWADRPSLKSASPAFLASTRCTASSSRPSVRWLLART